MLCLGKENDIMYIKTVWENRNVLHTKNIAVPFNMHIETVPLWKYTLQYNSRGHNSGLEPVSKLFLLQAETATGHLFLF